MKKTVDIGADVIELLDATYFSSDRPLYVSNEDVSEVMNTISGFIHPDENRLNGIQLEKDDFEVFVSNNDVGAATVRVLDNDSSVEKLAESILDAFTSISQMCKIGQERLVILNIDAFSMKTPLDIKDIFKVVGRLVLNPDVDVVFGVCFPDDQVSEITSTDAVRITVFIFGDKAD